MSQFYARYVPQASPNLQVSEPAKRKRPATKLASRPSKKAKVNDVASGNKILEKYSSTRAAKNQNDDAIIKKRKTKTSTTDDAKASNEEKESGTKHVAVLSKYGKSKEHALQAGDDLSSQAQMPHAEYTAPHEKHGLEPIPQPEATDVPFTAPSFNTKPDWLNNPIRADRAASVSFESLGLGKPLLERLHAQEKVTTLPIQAAVLPLLLHKSLDQRSDVCVSAATGSGKTFAYVLPILQDLQKVRVTKLRAVILAPTRTLVRQVSQVCESCSSGLGLKIATAEGSRALKEEQRLLVEKIEVYDPQKYARQQKAAIDWSTFSLRETLNRVGDKNFLDSVDLVTEYKSKIDILITTPGRLVEHLKSTKGFSLKDVQWFVIDEADRLLNESYQEWLEIVMPELNSQEDTEARDQILKHMRMDVPTRKATKILLSATMTSDVSQLMQLNLRAPKLVVMGNEQKDTEAAMINKGVTDLNSKADDLVFQLPENLSETVIPLKDKQGPQKPLFLLNLLQTHIWTQKKPEMLDNLVTDETDSDEDSTDVISSDESTSTSDSESTSSLSSSDTTTSSSDRSEIVSPSRNGFLLSKSKDAMNNLASGQRTLVFTRSTESAARLARLLAILAPDMTDRIAAYTSGANSRGSSRKTLTAFKNGRISVLISTDLAGRGLNIERLEHVVNYDVPANALTYVHRVGRTARAGLQGHAWSLVEHRQGKWFWEEIGGKAVNEPKILREGKVNRMQMSIEDDGLRDRYESALQQLGEDVRGQKSEA